MGEMIEFASDGGTARGYLAPAASGQGPGVVVLQEWWGLVPQLAGVCDRLAVDGFTALAPDLYHGELAEHDEMDKAAHLMNTMPIERAATDMGAAIDALLAHGATTGDQVGVIGFCMGGMLTLVLAAQEDGKIGAAVPYYGAPIGDGEPNWSNLTAPVHGHFATDDGFFGADGVRDLEARLKAMGKDVTFEFHEGTGHAFANEQNPLGTWNAEEAAKAWASTLAFLHEKL